MHAANSVSERSWGGGGGGGGGGMQELSVRVSWLCHADATFFTFVRDGIYVYTAQAAGNFLAVKMVFCCLAQTTETSAFSMCLSRVECSLENGLCQSTNPFFFDVHAGVFVLL